MVHSNKFVLAVKDSSRKVLREIAGKVYLPFHSEYSLLLKNNNCVRCCCSVSIDGTDVLGGDELIINTGSSIDLERFLVDGDMNKGNRFKFVPLSDGRVADPSNPENGLIEVKFWKEVVYGNPIKWYTDGSDAYKGFIPPSSVYTSSSGYEAMLSSDPIRCNNVMNCSFVPDGAGATVEGSVSSQKFQNADFGFKESIEPTILRLTLVGRQEPLTVNKTRHIHCPKCGKKNSYSNSFCTNCGKGLRKVKLAIQS